MERITINREDELFIWVLKADLACIVCYQSQADTAAEADGPQGNTQGGTRKFLGHFKCYSESQISSEPPREKFVTEN